MVQPPKRPTANPKANTSSANAPSTPQRNPGAPLAAKTPPVSFLPALPGQAAPAIPTGAPTMQAGPQARVPQAPMRPLSPRPDINQPVPSSADQQGLMRQEAAAASMPVGRPPVEVVKGQQGIIQAGTNGMQGFESIAATSKAAERWRESWRVRQHDEAGPATSVSRGQASVSRPLLAMQHSFARMRAVILPKKEKEDRGSLTFWISIVLMVCVIVGLGAYIISTYLPQSKNLASQVAPSSSTGQPTLSVVGTLTAAITQGQILRVQGKNFEIGDPVIFYLDTSIPINGSNGRQLTVTVGDQGTFTAAIPVSTTWSAGTHIIEAHDNRDQQDAYLNITIMLSGTPTTTGPFAFSLQNRPITMLSFTGIAGQDDPAPQHITLKNTTSTPYYWNAMAVTNDNLSWLHIDDDHTGGYIQADGSGTLGIGVWLTGLTSSKKPYSGSIIFTLNSASNPQQPQQSLQLTLPVELLVKDAPIEMVFSPNPVVGTLATAGAGTCSPGSALTLINLGTSFITWTVNMDANAQNHIMFTFNGKASSSLQGQLAPGAAVTLPLTCNGVQTNQVYGMTISGNGAQYRDSVSIQSP
ncbi:MAG TPA: hypothetical protein VKV40_16480 [Ktedonobacteraceae bacterium]|nr:hypothetical protein [Ktedonobacteraceae bacterium]